VPFASGWAADTDQVPLERVVVSVWRAEPEVPDPENTLTVIVDESEAAVPAVPENGGVRSVVVLPLTGRRNVTFGATVSTVQATRAGVGSCLPEGLIARTAKACRPSTSPA
jgi:hypothetical protein